MGEEMDYSDSFVQQLDRARGCLMGQLVGDALGSLVEFQSAHEIRCRYPDGVRELVDGGTWNTIAGQPTDDSEMALLLARTLVEHGTYNSRRAFFAYKFWLDSGPFDCGGTIASGLRGNLNFDSQANGAMMRISPLGIFGAKYDTHIVGEWAAQDAAITHPNPICVQANMLFAMAIAHAISSCCNSRELYENVKRWAHEMSVEPALENAVIEASKAPPENFAHQQGWVLIAFRNALWQLLNAPNFEEGVVDTVMRGGDTDTNAAICGALLGAVHGVNAVPKQWSAAVLNCRPECGREGIFRPRPECFWPVDALELAEKLLG
jgi:ADP-ribosylglycohydrolase